MFEDGKTNVSIHLKDVKPERYLGKSYKEMKKISETLYNEFSPDQIIPKLNKFLKMF
jgi:heptosyltransferase-2